MRRPLPYPSLRALESAARHRSYSRAARELNVTHGAVSHQLRRLEQLLGAPLFERSGNDMIPTPEAERLAGEISRALAVMGDAVDAFQASAECDPLVISISGQFASYWLSPRLGRLPGGGANLDLRVEDRMVDFAVDGIDAAVRYGRAEWPGLESRTLFWERLFPVCSPAFAATHDLKTPEDLLTTPLVHQTHRPWRLWLAPMGLTAPAVEGPVFSDSAILIDAAVQGLGVALARSGLVERDLRAGRLIRPFPEEVDPEAGFHLVWRADSRKLRRIEAFRDWLLQEVTKDPARLEETPG
jgi:LysR family glycine cleavage system transcriptional activator